MRSDFESEEKEDAPQFLTVTRNYADCIDLNSEIVKENMLKVMDDLK